MDAYDDEVNGEIFDMQWTRFEFDSVQFEWQPTYTGGIIPN